MEDQYLDSYWEDRNEMLNGYDDDDNEPDYYYDDEPDDMTDVEADADTLKNCGWGTDEDYGHFGPDE
jgi:hypothetical protein